MPLLEPSPNPVTGSGTGQPVSEKAGISAAVLAPGLRGAALAIGLVAAVGLVGDAFRPGFDVSFLWISPGRMPAPLFKALLAVFSLALTGHALGLLRRRWLRVAGAAAVWLVALLAALDAIDFYRLLASGAISTPAVVPGSFFTCLFLAALGANAFGQGAAARSGRIARAAAFAVGSMAALAALPLVSMFTFGPTRYARPADAAVVLGAQVHSDGTPSLALADRIDEGVRLYREGYARTLIMSGDRDLDHGRSEPEAMKARAVEAGVPAEDVLIDEKGSNTFATVRNAAQWAQDRGGARILAVSHYYHEPRIKMLFHRRGIDASTVPARMTRRLVMEPWYIARETAAFWYWWAMG
jgi:uncharacterized SAM-binding protein YcdF (DUF218 family)